MIEREVKLLVDASFEFPNLDDILDGARATRVEALHQHAVYFDTEDLRLTRAGVSLRHRSDDDWTVKLPVAAHAGLLTRGEYRLPGDFGDPPAAARGLVRSRARRALLGPVATVDTERSRIFLTDPAGHTVAEVTDDRVEARVAGGEALRFREVEVELAADVRVDVAAAIADALVGAGATLAPPQAKVARALGPAGAEPPDVATPSAAAVGPRASVEALVRAACAAGVARLVEFDPVVRATEDSEAVHQARVGTRRLREDLRTFGPLLDPASVGHLRDELGWINGLFGAVRDADVLLARLDPRVEELPPLERGPARRVLGRIATERTRARTALLAALDGDRYATLLDDLVALVHEPPLRGEIRPDRRATKPAVALAAKSWRKLRRIVRRATADGPASDEDLHRIRKATKRARYAYEAITPVAPEGTKRFAHRLAVLQDLLGDHHDAVVARERLAAVATTGSDVREAFAAGDLAGRLLAEEQLVRDAWPLAWERVRDARGRMS